MFEIDNPFGPAVVIAQLLTLLVELVAGINLLRLAARTGKLPERLMGASFLLRVVSFVLILYALLAIRSAHVQNGTPPVPGSIDPNQLDLGWTPFVAAAGWIAVSLSNAARLFFTALVFRPGQLALHRVIWVLVVASWAAIVAHGLDGGFSRGFGGVAFWLMTIPGIVSAFWIGGEAFHYHSLMRRRFLLGLAEPVVVNRFLLFGWASVFGFMNVILGLSPAFYTGLDLETVDQLASASLLIMAFTNLAEAGCWWLAFFPSRRYAAFLEHREAARRKVV